MLRHSLIRNSFRCVLAFSLIGLFPILVPNSVFGQAVVTEEKPETETSSQDASSDGEEVSLDPIVAKIIEIGQTDNHVQDHLDFLTNRIGPRLTGSEGLTFAGEWARDEFKEMGLESRMVEWGEVPVGFERGASFGRMVEPKTMTLNFGTNAWTAGTKGRSVGKVIIAPKTMEKLKEIEDEVKGAFVFTERMSRRRRGSTAKKTDDGSPTPTAEERAKMREEALAVQERIKELEPAGIIRSTSDNLILTGGNFNVEWDNLPTVPVISLQKEQYDEIKEMVVGGEEVKLLFDIRNHFRKGPIKLYNVIADIPGTEFPDEYVVVGGHLDSWDGATGATDNAAGCATTMEAARILMAAKVKPRRTIRFMLWSGEEQGLLGSRAYVDQNKDEVQRISSVFVHDGGTNYVAGIRCTEAMKADFEKVFAPVMNLDENAPFEITTTPSMRPRGGSDHVPFIRAGVPGFFWSQRGRATYRTTHHTQFDTYESIVPEYQKHSSIVIAVGAYGTANLDKLIPREGIDNGTR